MRQALENLIDELGGLKAASGVCLATFVVATWFIVLINVVMS